MKIVAPVSRSLPAADRTKSTAFYRDVLGFEERDRELIHGPARLWFEDADKPETYFETDELTLPRLKAGRRPAGRVAFQPGAGQLGQDGDVLPHRPGRPYIVVRTVLRPSAPGAAGPRMQKALPCLPVGDVAAAVRYYVDVLGFQINYQQGDLGVMDRDNITVLLVRRGAGPAAGSMYVYVRDADALYTELKAKGANVEGEPVSHPWGLRDFEVEDLDGNDIRFGQPFE